MTYEIIPDRCAVCGTGPEYNSACRGPGYTQPNRYCHRHRGGKYQDQKVIMGSLDLHFGLKY